ncbi:MAG: hypothetical protein AABY22_36025 [Nanoarchaeota archaeon]
MNEVSKEIFKYYRDNQEGCSEFLVWLIGRWKFWHLELENCYQVRKKIGDIHHKPSKEEKEEIKYNQDRTAQEIIWCKEAIENLEYEIVFELNYGTGLNEDFYRFLGF